MATIATEDDLHSELLSLYRRTGEATGYWAHYFLREVRRHGGMSVARKLLDANRVSTGFDRLVQARRADLSIEALALTPQFSHLFSEDERQTARSRLAGLPPDAFPTMPVANPAFPTDVPEGAYVEGSVQRVLANRYERNVRARAACIQHFGAQCSVCDLRFVDRYGEVGTDFIEVHHKRPLATLGKQYHLDPIKDLVPVCPNCHAMLHRRDPPYDVEQLRFIVQSA
jgi:5-methylcytosine-specific restriction protein A